MTLRQKKTWLNRTLWLVYLPVLIGLLMGSVEVMLLSVPLVIIWAIAVSVLWRCPYCEKRIGRPDMKLTYCPHCGKELDLNEV